MRKNGSLLKVVVFSALVSLMAKSTSLANNNVKDKVLPRTEVPANKVGFSPIYRVSELNTMAETALDKKQYEKCINLCERVLITGEKKEWALACYSMGRAYMGLHDYKKASLYFQLAMRYYKEFGIARKDKTINYEELYTLAINEAEEAKTGIIPTTKNTRSR